MPKIRKSIEVEISMREMSAALSDFDLVREMKERDIMPETIYVELEEASATLDESAMILRKQGRSDLAFRLDEIRKEL